MNPSAHRYPASYRDPAGFIFEEDGILYRQLHPNYRSSYEQLMQSGLYQRLVNEKLLIPHKEISQPNTADAFLIIQPQRVRPVIPPFCWTYDMLREAALLTLRIQAIALQHGMTLKDAHPSNIQFLGTTPVLIDTLSFVPWNKTKPWIAYRQYCESFLLPLVIGHYGVPDSPKLLRAWPGGIPLETGRTMLPLRSKLSLHWLLHLHLHARHARAEKQSEKEQMQFSSKKMNDLVQSLEAATGSSTAPTTHSNWTTYEKELQERGQYTPHKLKTVREETARLSGIKTLLDLGSNTGLFSHSLQQSERTIIQIESDPPTANLLYRKNKNENTQHSTTLCLNIETLLPGAADETLVETLASDLVLCLGLLHHLIYRNNIPLPDVLSLLSRLSKKYVWIEFIDSEDPLLREYFNVELVEYRKIDATGFEASLSNFFTIHFQTQLADSSRRLYLCEKK